MPTMKQPAPNRTRCEVPTHSAMPSALQTPAATMAQRSPQRMVMNEAGMLLSSEPMPISATISAAIGTEAPRSRAVSGTIGRMAPSPMPNSSDGPKAGTAMRRRENGDDEDGAGEAADGDGMRGEVRVGAPARAGGQVRGHCLADAGCLLDGGHC